MAKYKCPFCKNGYAHTSGLIPNPNEWLYLSDVAFDQLNSSADTTNLYNSMGHIYKCITESCESLLIFNSDVKKEPKWYTSMK